MILDAIIILLLFVALIVGWKLKVSLMLLVLLGNIISVIISAFLGDYLAPIIYESYVKPEIVESISRSVSSATGDYISVVEELPAFVKFALSFTGFSADTDLSQMNENLSLSIADAIEMSINPIVISVMSIILSALIFSLVFLLYRFLIMHFLLKVFKLPVLSGVDSFLGALCGILVTVVLVSFFAFLLKTITPYVEHMPFILSESTIYNSYIFYHFYSGNIFYKVISIF